MGKEPWYQLDRGLDGTQQSGHAGKHKKKKKKKHHLAHPCKDSESKNSYKRRTAASEVPPILIPRRKNKPLFNLEGRGNFFLLFQSSVALSGAGLGEFQSDVISDNLYTITSS